jgi:hypothetical protein
MPIISSTSACSSTDTRRRHCIPVRQSSLCDTAVVNERFVSVIINKDVDFTPTRNAPFELVDAFTYRTASSKALLPLRVKRSPSKFSTDLRRKKMRTFYQQVECSSLSKVIEPKESGSVPGNGCSAKYNRRASIGKELIELDANIIPKVRASFFNFAAACAFIPCIFYRL